MRHFRNLGLSPAMVVSLIALLMAMTGTATAAGILIGSAQIKDRSIRLVDLNRSTVTALRGARGKQGPQGPAGPAGSPGPSGPAGGFDPSKVSYVTGPTVSVPGGQIGGASASCPAGTKVIGGGFFVNLTNVGGSTNNIAGTSWVVGMINRNLVPVDINATAVCVAP